MYNVPANLAAGAESIVFEYRAATLTYCVYDRTAAYVFASFEKMYLKNKSKR